MKCKVFYLLITSLAFYYSCSMNSGEKGSTDNIENDSIAIVREPYKNNPDQIEYVIPILKDSKLRHGIQKRYYKQGSLYSEIPYVRNKRIGTAYTYYKASKGVKPQVWKEQPYVDGKLDGICRRFHSDGQLQAEYSYIKGMPGSGLKEYTLSGKLIEQPDLILSKSMFNAYIRITAKLSKKSQKVTYYESSLVEGQFLSKNRKKLNTKDGIGEILIPITTNKKNISIVAVMTTSYHNKYIVEKTIGL